jgi:hypothetical protein
MTGTIKKLMSALKRYNVIQHRNKISLSAISYMESPFQDDLPSWKILSNSSKSVWKYIGIALVLHGIHIMSR